jgi:hypothetical protein
MTEGAEHRIRTVSEIIAEGIERAEQSGVTLSINRAKVIQLHLIEQGYKIVRGENINHRDFK